MTMKEAVKWEKEIEALRSGKIIQSLNHDGRWCDNLDPVFALNNKYRIKPDKPIEAWALVYGDGTVLTCAKKDDLGCYTEQGLLRTVKLREVID